MVTVGVDDSSLQADSQVNWLGLKVGGRLALTGRSHTRIFLTSPYG